MEEAYKYKRVLIKLSGEALKGDSPTGFSAPAVTRIVELIKSVIDNGIEVALVIGGRQPVARN